MHLHDHDKVWVPIIALTLKLCILAPRLVSVNLPHPRHIHGNPINKVSTKWEDMRYLEKNLQHPSRTKQAQNNPVTLMEVIRLLTLLVRETRHEPTRIRNRQLQRRRGSALVVARAVVAVPREDTRDSCIHACCHEERHAVLNLWVGRLADDAVADDGDGEGAQHDWAAEGKAVR